MGQAKLRKIEIQQLKEKVEDTLLYTDGLFEICEILDLNQKKKWMIRYKNEYLGGLKNASDLQLYEKTVRFIKAKINGVDVGFIRINDKSHHFSEYYEGNVWSVTDAFVEREFQRRGVLRKLIQYAVNELCVKMCFMEKMRYEKHKSYYESLGFTFATTSTDGAMSWLFQSDMKQYV
jgi:hypothetical protein